MHNYIGSTTIVSSSLQCIYLQARWCLLLMAHIVSYLLSFPKRVQYNRVKLLASPWSGWWVCEEGGVCIGADWWVQYNYMYMHSLIVQCCWELLTLPFAATLYWCRYFTWTLLPLPVYANGHTHLHNHPLWLCPCLQSVLWHRERASDPTQQEPGSCVSGVFGGWKELSVCTVLTKPGVKGVGGMEWSVYT